MSARFVFLRLEARLVALEKRIAELEAKAEAPRRGRPPKEKAEDGHPRGD